MLEQMRLKKIQEEEERQKQEALEDAQLEAMLLVQ